MATANKEIKKIPIRIVNWNLEIDENRIYPPKGWTSWNGTKEINYETGKKVHFKLLICESDSKGKFGDLIAYNPLTGEAIYNCGRTTIEDGNDFDTLRKVLIFTK